MQNPGGGTADTLVPVLDYSTADTYGYLVNSYAGGGHDVSLYKFSDSSPPGALIGANVATPSYIPAQPAVQKGSSGVVVDTGSAAITQAVNYTYGMYATLTNGFVNSGGVANILWMKFNPNTQTAVNYGQLYDSSLAYFDSSISEESNGSTMYTYAVSGPTIYPSSAMAGMNVNNMFLENQYVHQGAYPTPQTGSKTCSGLPCSRWGDFTSTYTDYSVNNNALWSASQDMANSSLWGTVIAYASA